MRRRARLVRAQIEDHDTRSEARTSRHLIDPITFDDPRLSAGEFISAECSYVLRPVGPSDPTDNVTIIVTKIGWDDIGGITSLGALQKGIGHQLISGEDCHPQAEDSSLYVCFAPGIEISTPNECRATCS
ncbi:hypothetical protein FGG78_06105 [Thioclava sp. BHET1]|nr:hypothetical protein FGG78_06105 [Thioclava sp. BHET1]